MAITRKPVTKKPVAKAIVKASPVIVEEDIVEAKTEPTVLPNLAAEKHERVDLMIMKSSDKHAVDPVPVSVNGYCMTIKRGEWVKVPKPYVEALNNAVEMYYDQAKDPETGGMIMRQREAHSYPFQTR